MKLIFIRHGDPDYERDSLTEKGWKEAALLAKRIAPMQVRDYFCSPLGRAKDTASLTFKENGRSAEILEWLREFHIPITDPLTGKTRIPWDLMPAYWTERPMLYDKDRWMLDEVMSTGPVAERAALVRSGIDELLESYGYKREGNYYRVTDGNEDTLVFFCHLGVQFVVLSHLFGIAAPILWQNFFVAPTSVTVVKTEERQPGIAAFRCQMLGDISHLYIGNEPFSESGFFIEKQ